MSVFWKPIHPPVREVTPASRYKRLGSGLYELWARCDICHASGPHHRFASIFKGELLAHVCDGPDCGGAEDTWVNLRGDGWSVL